MQISHQVGVEGMTRHHPEAPFRNFIILSPFILLGGAEKEKNLLVVPVFHEALRVPAQLGRLSYLKTLPFFVAKNQ